MRKQDIICIQCPLGCRGTVIVDETGGKATLEGYECKEGKKYAEIEAHEPLRVLTATVITESKRRPLLPVKSSKAIPKDKLSECVRVLAGLKVKPPVAAGQVLVPDIFNTGANIVSTAEIVE
jgi:CxxC motif-containing protein